MKRLRSLHRQPCSKGSKAAEENGEYKKSNSVIGALSRGAQNPWVLAQIEKRLLQTRHNCGDWRL